MGTAGAAATVSYTATGTFTAPYTAYISNDNFVSNSTAIGSGASPISATIPTSVASGTNYRIRVEAAGTSPTYSDNSTNLTVTNYQTNEVTAFTATPGNTQVVLTWTKPTTCITRTVVVASTSAITATPSGTSTASAAFGAPTSDLGSGQFVVYDGAASTVTVTALTNGTPYFFKAFTSNGDGYSTGVTATATPAAPTPTLTASTAPATAPTAIVLANTSQGTPSASKSYTLTGSNLGTGAVTVQAPTGFQVATAATFVGVTTDANSLTITPAAGSISQSIFVRLTGTSSGAFSGTVTNTNGTQSADVLVSGNVIATAAEPTVQPTITTSNITFNSVDITIGGGNGQKRLLVVRANSATNALPVDNTTYTASTVRGSGTPIGTNNFVVVADGTTTAFTLTGLSPTSTYVLSVYAYNDNTVAGQENYLTSTPGTVTFSTPAIPAIFYSKATGDLSLTSTFGTNLDGSGASPSNFTANGKTYSVSGTHTLSGAWAVSGTSSKVVLTTGSNLTVPVAFNLNADLDMEGTAYLTVLHTSPNITYGTLEATSTVEFAQTSGAYIVPGLSGAGAGYGNLKLKNGTKRFASNQTDIYGNLIIEDASLVGGTSTTVFSTLALDGSLTLLGTTTFDATAVRRMTLLLYGATPQTIEGNGITLRLFSLQTKVSGGGAILSDANGGTPVQLGNPSGGGIDLTNGSTLALNGNTLSFTPGGQASISNTGTFTFSPTSSLNLESAATSGTIGSLFITPGFATLNNLRLSHRATDYLDVSESLTINGALTLDTDGSLEIGPNQSLTLNGTVAGTGTVRGAATSDLLIGGTGAFGTLRLGTAAGSSQLRNLTINRPTGAIALGSPATVNGALTLTDGILTTTATNLLSLTSAATASGSSSGFVSGPLARATAAAPATVLFPLGKGTAYRPLTLNIAAQTSATTYTAEQKDGLPASQTFNGDIKRVSRVRSFTVMPTAPPTGFSGTITLSFGSDDRVTDPAAPSLVIAKNSGSGWDNIGRTANTSSTLTSDVFTSFSDFVLASTDSDLTTNPLPVELTSFSAQRQADNNAVAVKWATASEKNSARFEVQRSLNGREFATVATVAAQGNSTQPTAYATLDQSAPAAALYYRLRQVDRDGTTSFSPAVSVKGTGLTTKVLLYPNPAQSRISFLAEAATPYRVLNQLGQTLLHGTTEAGTATVPVATLPAGLYLLELQTPTGRVVQKFEKE
ncbi:MAG: hypothetical protein JWR44_2050 [Hymenobacter sp.]|nr:hypothetical protein [Hymenobacter sp.]